MYKQHEIIIIGAGPAGISAAIQLKRAGTDVVLIEKNKTGGLLRNAFSVENNPFTTFGINGKILTGNMINNLKILDIQVFNDNIKSINFNRHFILEGKNHSYKARFVIAAVGTVPVIPDFIGITRSKSNRIFFEVADFIPENSVNKQTCFTVAGGGEAAADYSLTLAAFGKVNLLIRGTKIKANQRLKNELLQNPSIKTFFNTEISSVTENNGNLLLNLITSDTSKQTKTDYLFIATGRKSALSEIVLDFDLQKTQKEFFVVGDALRGNLGQSSIAAGDGLLAASEIIKNLRSF